MCHAHLAMLVRIVKAIPISSRKDVLAGLLMRLGFRGRFGVATAPAFSIRIRCIEASLEDRAFQPLEGLSIRAGAPPVPGCRPYRSKLSGVAPTVVALQEVDPDKSPR